MRYWFHRICVGVRSDASIDIDIMGRNEDDDGNEWNFNQLSIEEAEFLLEELTNAVGRAKLRKQALDLKKPKYESECEGCHPT